MRETHSFYTIIIFYSIYNSDHLSKIGEWWNILLRRCFHIPQESIRVFRKVVIVKNNHFKCKKKISFYYFFLNCVFAGYLALMPWWLLGCIIQAGHGNDSTLVTLDDSMKIMNVNMCSIRSRHFSNLNSKSLFLALFSKKWNSLF